MSSSKSNQLFVGRLPSGTTTKDLEDIFYSYGKMTRCDVKEGNRTAYGFVEFEEKEDAEYYEKEAMKGEQGREMKGLEIVIEWSYSSKGGEGRGRGRGGGYRGRSRGGGYRGNYRSRGYGGGGGGDYRGSYRDDYRDDYGYRGGRDDRGHYDDHYHDNSYGGSSYRDRSRERY